MRLLISQLVPSDIIPVAGHVLNLLKEHHHWDQRLTYWSIWKTFLIQISIVQMCKHDVLICVCVYICLHVCVFVFICMCIYICMCVFIYVYVYIYLCMPVCLYMFVHMFVYVCIYDYVYLPLCVFGGKW